MEWLKGLPEWIWTTIVGALFAVLGYFGKTLVDWLKDRRKEQAGILSSLLKLQSILKASRAIFIIQKKLVDRMLELLRSNYKDKYLAGLGYEDSMVQAFNLLSEKDKILHSIIRGYTEYPMRHLNQELIDWLRADNNFKTAVVNTRKKREISQNLIDLETHLLLWHAKYEYWIPGHPEHSLVYLADESEHGLGFPSNLDGLINETVDELLHKSK
jgi:hypothetical protein